MKKVFYSLAIFLSIFIINVNVVKAEKYVCVYTYTENGKNLTYYVDMNDESTDTPKVKVFSTISASDSLDGEKHTKNGTKWSIQNWENADGVVSPSISFKDSNGTCPGYLVYRPNADGNKDYLYFSTSIVSVNGYYTFKPISNIPDCTYVGQLPTNEEHSKITSGAVLNVWYNNGNPIYTLSSTNKFYNYNENYNVNTGSFTENSELKNFLTKSFSDKKKYGNYELNPTDGSTWLKIEFPNRSDFVESYLETGSCPTMHFNQDSSLYTFGIYSDGFAEDADIFKFSKSDFENNIIEDDVFTCGPYKITQLKNGTNLENVVIDVYFRKNKISNAYEYYYSFVDYNDNNKTYSDTKTLFDPYSDSYRALELDYSYVHYTIGVDSDAYKSYISALDGNSCPSTSSVNVNYNSDPRFMYLTLKQNSNTGTYDETFKKYLGGLKNPLSIYAPKALDYTLTVEGAPTTLSGIDANDTFCTSTECAFNAGQYTITAIEKIKRYCSSVYRYESNNTVKKAECTSFTNFLNSLVNDGVLSLDDISTGCGFITGGLSKEIKKIFNIIKIAGPILAVLLGMIDFAKAVASPDADKEMKDANKRFIRRLIAAALLFIVPTLLSFLINIFIGDKLGEDVYCDLFDNTINTGRPTGGSINHGNKNDYTSDSTGTVSKDSTNINYDRMD